MGSPESRNARIGLHRHGTGPLVLVVVGASHASEVKRAIESFGEDDVQDLCAPRNVPWWSTLLHFGLLIGHLRPEHRYLGTRGLSFPLFTMVGGVIYLVVACSGMLPFPEQSLQVERTFIHYPEVH